jgi:DNA polymerase-3 subunit delta'
MAVEKVLSARAEFPIIAAMSDLYPWLEPARKTIVAALQQGRFPHALLLTGQPGSGKAAFSNYLAQLLLCQQHTASHAPCGSCPGCIQFAAGGHPDYFHVTHAVDEKTGKKSREIKVDQIRALAGKLVMSSHHGGYQVAIVDPAEAMNKNAANSLLKTLEEPSDNTVLVLVSASPASLAATVRSRCQQLKLEMPERSLALEWLQGQGCKEQAQTCLQLAHGAPLEALKLAQSGTLEARREHFSELVGILERRISPLTVAQGWSKDEDLQAIHWMREWLMDLIRIRMAGKAGQLRSADLQDGLAMLAGRLDHRAVFELLERINRMLRLTAGSLNRQLLTEDILLAWAAQK